MTIVHISDCYMPRVGGIETQVHALALMQADAGHQVHVITATGPGVPDGHVGDARVQVHRVAMWMPLDVPVHLWPAGPLRRLLATTKPDIVHVHVGVVSPLSWCAVRLADDVGLPTVVTVHSYWTGGVQRAFAWSDPVVRWSRRRVTWSAVSGVVAARVRQALPAIGTVHVVPNGIDAAWWRTDPIAASGREVRVVSAARFVRLKAIRAAASCIRGGPGSLARGPRLVLACAGDGHDRRRIERFARRHPQLRDVRFLGRLSRGALRALYAASDAETVQVASRRVNSVATPWPSGPSERR